MPVVTISRGVFSGGEALAVCLAGRLGCRCLGREELVQYAAAGGVSEKELLEAMLKSPGLLERLRPKRRLYLTLIQAALAEQAATGELVYHGNAGHLLLQGAGPVLRVRIVAPLEFRLAQARERPGLGPEEAAALIARKEDESRKWTRYLYGAEWGDPILHDLVINLKHVTLEQACEVVAGMAGLECFAFTVERRTIMKDFALASRVRAVLCLDAGTMKLDLNVSCRAGVVQVRGFVGSRRGIREVQRVARAVPGVRRLDLDDLTVYHDV
jgi:osmotically-inducible protein OsmY